MSDGAKYFIESEDEHTITITDIGPTEGLLHKLTEVVKELHDMGVLKARRLFFYDHTGRQNEIMYDSAGKYRGIRL